MHRYIPDAACWWPMTPKPPVIGAAASDAQAAVGVCWYIPAGSAPESARLPSGSTTIGPWQVVSKCALRRGAYKEEGAPRSFPDTPASVPFCWSITAFSACVILPQMNRQPMCIWMVKPPFTQYISREELDYILHHMSGWRGNKLVGQDSEYTYQRQIKRSERRILLEIVGM